MITIEEQKQSEKLRIEINQNIDYIQKNSFKELKRINNFINGVTVGVFNRNKIEKIKRIIREDNSLAREFINSFGIEEVYCIANPLNIDEIKAYAKIYFKSFTIEEIEKIAIQYNGSFNDFILEKTGKELDNIDL